MGKLKTFTRGFPSANEHTFGGRGGALCMTGEYLFVRYKYILTAAVKYDRTSDRGVIA